MTSSPDTLTLSPTAAEAFAAALLRSRGVPATDAVRVAECLVLADLRGVDTHGLLRLPGYLERLDLGLVTPAPDLKPNPITPVISELDGQDGLGFVVATRAMEEAIRIAREFGMGLVGVRRSTHFGMAANYLLQAIDQGMAAFVFTNASKAMPPFGGRAELLGTSPFGVAVPNGSKGPHFVLDMAPTVAARGKVRKAMREGREIPLDWALDAEGRPTTDPKAALGGVMLPIAGPKGAGLSLMMDILCGVLTGANFGGDVGNQYKDYERPQGVGHFIFAFRPDIFLSEGDVEERMGELVRRMRATPLAEGFDEILMPGEREARLEAKGRAEGLSYRLEDLQPLRELAEAKGIAFPS